MIGTFKINLSDVTASVDVDEVFEMLVEELGAEQLFERLLSDDLDTSQLIEYLDEDDVEAIINDAGKDMVLEYVALHCSAAEVLDAVDEGEVFLELLERTEGMRDAEQAALEKYLSANEFAMLQRMRRANLHITRVSTLVRRWYGKVKDAMRKHTWRA